MFGPGDCDGPLKEKRDCANLPSCQDSSNDPTLFNPCKDVKHGDDIVLKKDRQNCKKFYVCQGQLQMDHIECGHSLSFSPDMNNGDGGCGHKDPREIIDCYS